MSQLTISIIQSSLHWEDRDANLRMFSEKLRSIDEKTEIVVLPEMFSTGFSMKPQELADSMDGPTLKWMKELAMERRIILTGSIIISENGNFYNRLIWMLPNGQHGYYDKRHRFAYAGEDEQYTAGKKRLIASVKGWKINLMICYDLRFPVWARQQSQEGTPEFDLMIYVANWPDKRSLAWRTLLQARAIENQSFVVGVNRIGTDGNGHLYSGESMVIDPMGETLYKAGSEEDIFTITLEKSTVENVREKFPFWKDADGFMLLVNED